MGSVCGPHDPVYPPGNAHDQQPCQTAINLATAYKQQGTTIYSIGYNAGNHACTAGKWPTIDVPGMPAQAARSRTGRQELLPHRRRPRRSARDHLNKHADPDRVAR
jgi:hypothetical protein